MKKFLTFLAAAAVLFNLSACKDDDGGEGDPKPNQMTIGSQTHELRFGEVVVDHYVNGMYLYNMFFYDNDTPYDADGDPVSGVFATNIYSLFSNNSSASLTRIPDGTYVYKEMYSADDIEDMKHNGYSDYIVSIDDEEWIEFGQDSVSESQLVITVKHVSGDIYEIEWTGGVDQNGNAVNGYYKGVMIFREAV